MIVGVTKEIKADEYRVGLTPAGVKTLTDRGHTVLVEAGAGLGSRIDDAAYAAAGGRILPVAAVWEQADMIVKVKEPLECEYRYFKPGLLLFTYLHLAADKALTEALLQSKVVGLAYETVQPEDHSLPLLAPMSEVAGRMSVQVGATCSPNRPAALACSWAAWPGCSAPGWSSWAAAPWVPRRSKWLWAWARM